MAFYHSSESDRAAKRTLDDPGIEQVQRYLMYGLSLPERAVRGTAALVGGAINESATLLVPQAFRDSTTYSKFVQEMLDMLNKDVGGVKLRNQVDEVDKTAPTEDDVAVDESAQEDVADYVAKKTVGTFIDLAGMATLHLSPMTVLAILSDLAYGSQAYLEELAVELKKESANVPLSLYDSRPKFGPSAPVTGQADAFRSGELATSGFQGWPDQIRREFQTNEMNGRIGTHLVFENASVRVWHMTLQPGEKMPVHRHVLTYFWTAITPGRFLQRTYDGTTYESNYEAGLTHYYDVGAGEFALHNLENVGSTVMIFCAVELKKLSANTPLPV